MHTFLGLYILTYYAKGNYLAIFLYGLKRQNAKVNFAILLFQKQTEYINSANFMVFWVFNCENSFPGNF